MQDYSESIMVALLPTSDDWCKIDLPHLTVVYAGKTSDRKTAEFNTLAKQVSDMATLIRPLTLKVIKPAIFGNEEKVQVLKLRPTPELLALRAYFESWNKSEHEFSPHVTVGEPSLLPIEFPRALYFNTLSVVWGDQQLNFSLV